MPLRLQAHLERLATVNFAGLHTVSPEPVPAA